MKFLLKVYQFMQGRYGLDELTKFLFIVYLLILVLNILLKNYIISYIELLIIIIMFYRFLSKNVFRRRKENDLYLKLKQIITNPFKNIIRNFKGRKEWVYVKCWKCKTVLRLPLPDKIGVKKTKCPTCNRRIRFLVLRHYKPEIIIKK